jgi:hypothetical protein
MSKSSKFQNGERQYRLRNRMICRLPGTIQVDFMDLRWSSVSQDPHQESPLSGNVTIGVVRVGDTVRRPAMPWSTSVDALLVHFREVGFEGAPRALGYDESGRQVLSFVEGLVDPDPSDLDVSRLTEVGRLIRCLHDASSTFIPPADTVWNVAIAPDKEDLICHHDLAPWNLVRTPTELTFIDWDNAGPGSRLWDLAYAAHGFVPLSPDASISDEVAGQRLAALVEGYGLDAEERGLLVDMLGPRIRSMYELLSSGHETGTQPWIRLWNEGHGTVWLADTAYVDERRSIWLSALGLTTDSTS